MEVRRRRVLTQREHLVERIILLAVAQTPLRNVDRALECPSTRAMVPRMMAGPPFGIRESVGLPTTLDGVGPCRIRDAPAVIGREALPQVGPQPRDISFGH